jgi:hypothetical protein
MPVLSFLSFFTNKYVIIVVVFAGCLIGAYGFGHSRGHDAGFKEAWNQQQKTINNMVAAQNAETQEQNTKISQLELSATVAYAQVQTAQQQAAKERNDAVAAYKKAHPQSANSCGWSPDTVQVINQILENKP